MIGICLPDIPSRGWCSVISHWGGWKSGTRYLGKTGISCTKAQELFQLCFIGHQVLPFNRCSQALGAGKGTKAKPTYVSGSLSLAIILPCILLILMGPSNLKYQTTWTQVSGNFIPEVERQQSVGERTWSWSQPNQIQFLLSCLVWCG